MDRSRERQIWDACSAKVGGGGWASVEPMHLRRRMLSTYAAYAVLVKQQD